MGRVWDLDSDYSHLRMVDPGRVLLWVSVPSSVNAKDISCEDSVNLQNLLWRFSKLCWVWHSWDMVFALWEELKAFGAFPYFRSSASILIFLRTIIWEITWDILHRLLRSEIILSTHREIGSILCLWGELLFISSKPWLRWTRGGGGFCLTWHPRIGLGKGW